MNLRGKFVAFSFLLFIFLLATVTLSIWTIHEISSQVEIINDGMALMAEARNLHSLTKDLIFDLFAPQVYTIVRGLVYSPRTTVTVREWSAAADNFKIIFDDFFSDPRLKKLLRNLEQRESWVVAQTMSEKAFQKIYDLQYNLERLRDSGKLGSEDLYYQILAGEDDQLILLFDELKETSFYLTNSFESFLNRFVSSLRASSEELSRTTLYYSALVLLFFSVCAFSVAIIFSRKIIRRVGLVERAIGQVSKGNFGLSLSIQTGDEFHRLAENINKFTSALRKNVNSVLMLLQDVTEALDTEHNLSEIMDILVHAIVKDIEADGAVILMRERGSRYFRVKGLRGTFPPPFEIPSDIPRQPAALENYFRNCEIDDARGIFGRTVTTMEAVFSTQNTDDDLLEFNSEEGPLYISSIMTKPLIIKNKLIGIIGAVTCGNERTLSDLDFIHLQTFTDYAAITLENYYKSRDLIARQQTEYLALQSQIQPHFMYNVLNGFIGLNRMNETETLEKSIFALKDMMRYIIEHPDETSLIKEFSFLEQYCELQTLRFGKRLRYSLSCSDDAAGVKIPKLLLQPLVENAVIHGIEPLSRDGEVTVTAGVDPSGGIVISVIDNGMGFQFSGTNGHHGLVSVRDRLLYTYPDAEFTIRSEIGWGTEVTISIMEGERI